MRTRVHRRPLLIRTAKRGRCRRCPGEIAQPSRYPLENLPNARTRSTVSATSTGTRTNGRTRSESDLRRHVNRRAHFIQRQTTQRHGISSARPRALRRDLQRGEPPLPRPPGGSRGTLRRNERHVRVGVPRPGVTIGPRPFARSARIPFRGRGSQSDLELNG